MVLRMKEYIYNVDWDALHECDCKHCDRHSDGEISTRVQVCAEDEYEAAELMDQNQEALCKLLAMEGDGYVKTHDIEILALTFVEERETTRGNLGEIRLVSDAEEERAREAANNPIDFD